MIYTILLSIFLLSFSCSSDAEKTKASHKTSNSTSNNTNSAQVSTSNKIQSKNSSIISIDINKLKSKFQFDDNIELEIVGSLPHSTNSYTQGLFYYDGYLYESTGKYGQSSLQKIDVKTGVVVNKYNLPASVFAEGITLLNGKIYLVTWRERKCFVFDLQTFNLVNTISYSGEAWGLENDGQFLLRTGGGSELLVLDPNSFSEISKIDISDDGKLIDNANELELIGNEIWANIYQSDDIIRFNKNTGELIQRLDLSALRTNLGNNPKAEVLNGIAFNYDKGTFYMTGKNWSKIFEMKIVSK